MLLSYCDRIFVNGAVRKLTEGDRQDILKKVEELSREAYRTLGEAYRPLETASLSEVPGIRTNAAGDVSDISEQADVIEHQLVWMAWLASSTRRAWRCATPWPKRTAQVCARS